MRAVKIADIFPPVVKRIPGKDIHKFVFKTCRLFIQAEGTKFTHFKTTDKEGMKDIHIDDYCAAYLKKEQYSCYFCQIKILSVESLPPRAVKIADIFPPVVKRIPKPTL